MSTAELTAVAARLEAVAARLEAVAAGGGGGGGGGAAAGPAAEHPRVAAFDELLATSLAPFLELSKTLGGAVGEQSADVATVFSLMRDLVKTASSSKKPSWPPQDMKGEGTPFRLYVSMVEAVQKITAATDKARPTDFFNHCSTVSEGIPAANWVAVDKTPGPFVGEMVGASSFYGNKILIATKGKSEGKDQFEWAKSFKTLLTNLQAYIKEHQTTGLAWNLKGGDAMTFDPAAVVLSAAAAPTPAAGGGGGDGPAPSLAAFDELLGAEFAQYVAASKTIGGKTAEQAAKVEECFAKQRALLECATASKKPAGWPNCPEMLQPMSECIMACGAIKDSADRGSDDYDYCCTWAEGIQAASWVCIEPAPGPFIGETQGSAMYHGNKLIMKGKKDGNDVMKKWGQSTSLFLKGLQAFVKQHHTTGVAWNPRGANAAAFKGSAPAAPGPPPPGPPPPGPPPKMAAVEAAPAARSGLFAELSKGADITKGLKKAPPKNKPGEVSGAVVMKAKKPAKTWGGGAKKKGTPKFAREGTKWLVEWQEGNRDIIIEETNAKQAVRIYKCENCLVQIKGKVNAVNIDGCKKVSVIFADVVSSCDVVNSQSIEMQATGKVPNVMIDQTDGAQVYLTEAALDAQIILSKSSEINVSVPGATPEDDLKESALPEQFCCKMVDGVWVTEAVHHG